VSIKNKLLFLAYFLLSSVLYAQERTAYGQIETIHGKILIKFHEETPLHKASFIELASKGYWDSLTFNRVIPNFVAQGGCPDTEEGFTDPEYLLQPEFHPELRHIYGAVGAGRDDNPDKISARCQFYIVQNKSGLHRLDGNYTVFGQVIHGMDIIDRIVNVSRDQMNQPLEPITLKIDIVYLSAKELSEILGS